MKKRHFGNRLLATTAALAVAVGSVAPLPVLAQAQTEGEAAPVVPPATDAPAADAPEQAAPEAEAPAPEAAAPEAGEAEPPATEPDQAPDVPETVTPETTPADNAEPDAVPEAAPEAAPEAEPEVAPEARPDAATEDPAPETTSDAATEAPATEAEPAEEPAAETAAPTEAEPKPEPRAETAVDVPETREQAVETINNLLGGTSVGAAAAASDAEGEATETEITEENARSSGEDFATTASGERREDKDDDDGLSNLQKVGLLALGGLAVGALLNNGDEVVSNTGDRVVLRQEDGSFAVLKDDDALLRQPGSNVRTERFDDGSTRNTVVNADGSQVVTIRDATGRVLRRTSINANGTEVRLIDDTQEVAPVDVSTLPPARDEVRLSARNGESLREALARIEARDNARAYSLSQIREYRQVRALAPVVDVENVTFRTGSAAVDATQAEALADLGNLMRDLIEDNPGEVFLIEGHTDAVGSAASNLALSDRRAESVALALTEYFDVPPANMVVQGYGESDLRVESEGDEPQNRRVAVRIISPILQASAQ